MNPYLPTPEDCAGRHTTWDCGYGQAMCRYCGHHVLPSGRVSKRLKTWPPEIGQ